MDDGTSGGKGAGRGGLVGVRWQQMTAESTAVGNERRLRWLVNGDFGGTTQHSGGDGGARRRWWWWFSYCLACVMLLEGSGQKREGIEGR